MAHQGFVQGNVNHFSALYRILDLVLIAIVLLIFLILFSLPVSQLYFIVVLIATLFFYLTGESIDLYRSWRTDLSSRQILYTFISWSVAIFAVSLFLFFSKTSTDISRLVIGSWFLGCAIVLVSWRIVFRLYLCKRRSQGVNTRNVAIFGLTEGGVHLANEIINHSETGFILHGFYDDRDRERLASGYADLIQGDVEQGIVLARSGKFDIVYVALPLAAQKRIESILLALGDTTVDVHIVPDFFSYHLMHARLNHVGNTQTISVYESPLCGLSSLAKRIEDVIGATLILTLIALPMLLIALLIKLDSRGPVLFKQKRYGLSGKSIKVWKFRSMTVADDGAVVKQAIKGDTRITKLGALLRRTSLDELPQFINVLQGHMSIVGPRPHAIAHNEQYRQLVDFYMLRHKVKPGITGLAQVNGWRGETDTLEKMKKRVDCDLEYIRNWSILLDINIVLQTIFKGFTNKNAY